ncbi:MAG: response regulator [Lachnospiraceae bacterium]|nr:response regulator [Lachnospiraceae bacterium]
MRIVIVEDEIAIREGLEKMIKGNTHHTVIGTCKNGREGIEFIRDQKPDLVITDIRMNEMGGLEMLTKLREQQVEVLSIIISGYSEFEYARQAMRLGVEEYLLKPVSIDALQSALKKIENRIVENSLQIVKKPANYVREYFFGTEEEQKEAKQVIEKIFPENNQQIYGIFAGYLGNVKKENLEEIEYPLRSMKHQFPNMNYLEAWEKSLNFRLLIVKGEEEEIQEFAEMFDGMVRHSHLMQKWEVPWSMDSCGSIDDWRQCFENVRKMLSGCLSKGCTKLLTAQDFTDEISRELVYPMQIERRILSGLEKGVYQEVRQGIEEFMQQITQQEYGAEEIRHGVLKLMSRMIDVAKEINQKAYEECQEGSYLKDVFVIYTRTEIRQMLFRMAKKICDRKMKEGISNYTINRTLEYIRTHYKEGISLEKTAEVLNITPEYLSMLFKREMGMNFSVFLKEFRISHAKRLLKGTDMKIYEVAQECGYSNSNYFTKVFKEVTGISPAEYR